MIDYMNITTSAKLYLWDTLKSEIKDNFVKNLDSLLRMNSNSSIEFINEEPFETNDDQISALTSILAKIVERGNPTLISKEFEDRILELEQFDDFNFDNLKDESNNRLVGKSIKYLPKKFEPRKFVNEARSLFNLNFNYIQESHKLNEELPKDLKNITSEEEDIFIETVGKKISKGVQSKFNRQTLISELIGFENEDIIDQRVDFSLSVGDISLVIEIDGSEHYLDPSTRKQDKVRDKLLREAGWDVIRINAKEVRINLEQWINTLKLRIDEGGGAALIKEDKFLEDYIDTVPFLSIVYPHIVYKSLRAIIQSIRYNHFPVKDEVKLLIIEEDVPTAYEAIYQLNKVWFNLSVINENLPKPPIFKIHIIGKNPICSVPQVENFNVKFKNKPDKKYDVFISNSFTLFTYQNGLKENKYNGDFSAKYSFKIRNSSSKKQYNKLLWSPDINYHLNQLEKSLIKERKNEKFDKPENQHNVLVYFLQNIFRKHHFWEGQELVISRLLQGKTSVVLLPTGGGKSLTYQFAGLLLPGVSLIIDPLVSLMIDQVENLNIIGFDSAGYVSGILDAEERKKEIEKFVNGEYYYFFISPERLQIENFRNKIQTLVAQYPISLAVIDEVHCVSEWGHDFRTSYLHLGKNINKYCSSQNNYAPTLVGLTGTASFSVLTDVQTELNIKEEEAIVLPKSFDRKELIFHVEKADATEKPAVLDIIKQRMPRDFRKNPQTFFRINGKKTNSGIVFCPYASARSDAGVVKVAKRMGHSNYYAGSKPNGLKISWEEWREHKKKIQNSFKFNKIQEIVSTNSFGMGIDKPNIRYTIHYNIPHSVEAYYQEAGRAGRDGIKKSAHCYIIYSDNNWDTALEILKERNHRKALERLNQISRKEKGDILVRLWFLYSTYKDRDKEKLNAFRLWKDKLFPRIRELPINATNNITLNFSNKNKSVTEKSIYRLVLIGVVKEYSINFKKRSFDIKVQNVKSDEIINHLRRYLLKYKFEQYANKKISKITRTNIEETIKESLNNLVDFIYDEIVEKRKAALRTIAEYCRNFESHRKFREKILNYLQESEFSNELRNWINKTFNEIGFRKIDRILSQIDTLEKAKKLVGTTRRMLDEDPSNIPLRYLSCCARSKSKTESENSVLQEYVLLIDQIRHNYEGIPQKIEILNNLVDKIMTYRKNLKSDILKIILKEIGDVKFVRRYLKTHSGVTNDEIYLIMLKIIEANALKKAQSSNFYQELIRS